MENNGWIETKKECEIDEKGELVVTKVTLEAVKIDKKVFGLEIKELADIIIKISTLVAIIFTALGYFNTLRIIEFQKMADIEKFSQEKKLEAVSELKKNYSELATSVSEMARNRDSINVELVRLKIKEGYNLIRAKSIFWDEKEILEFSSCYWIYAGLISNPEKIGWIECCDFLNDVDRNFRIICRKALGWEQNGDYFKFVGQPLRIGRGAPAVPFFNVNYKEWKRLDSIKTQQLTAIKPN